MDVRPEKYISIYSDSQATLKALQIAKTMSPLVQQCQKALNDISTGYSVGLFWFPRHSRARGKEIAIQLLREGTIHQFISTKCVIPIVCVKIGNGMQSNTIISLEVYLMAILDNYMFRPILAIFRLS